MPINSAHQRYLELLVRRTGAERYPSHHFLQRIEDAISDRDAAEAYVDVLLTAAENQRYPSLRMIDRANRVVTKMAIADTVARLQEAERSGDRDSG